LAPPSDPLAISPDLKSRIGTDWDRGVPSPTGPVETTWFPYYAHQQGDARVRLLPPFFFERTRGLSFRQPRSYGVPATTDTEGLYGLLYYRRRSLELDMDVVFPAFWRIRSESSATTVLGPIVHREAPGEHDNWLAPLVFEGARRDGGYLHMPLLLTTSQWSPASSFTLVGPYFRTRTDTDVDDGVVPFFFHGDNGDIEGNRRSYTLIPPLLFYHQERELEASSLTVMGPLIHRSDPKRDIWDFAPLFFHIRGRPETGGRVEEHTTLLPFFHYGYDSESSLFILPGYYRRISQTTDTLLTPFFSRAIGRHGATTLTAAGPVLPLVWDYRDRDVGAHAWAVAPFFYTSDSPSGHDWLTPLIGRFETYGQSSTWWIFPTFTLASDAKGWETDLHPILYVGRSEDATHTVVAPVFWDFANSKGRTTVGFPVYWRFADTQDGSVTQVAGNTLYMQKRVVNGLDWQFHVLPLFSYGENPGGYFWNILFGLAGYTRDGERSTVRAFWFPFEFGGTAAAQTASSH
jgi:hypothetical protein